MEDKTVYNSIKKGLEEAIAHKKGKLKAKVVRRKVNVAPLPHYKANDIKKLREKLNLSQRTFGEVIGVSTKSIESWESGKSEPNGAAQRMLSIINKDESSLERYELLEVS